MRRAASSRLSSLSSSLSALSLFVGVAGDTAAASGSTAGVFGSARIGVVGRGLSSASASWNDGGSLIGGGGGGVHRQGIDATAARPSRTASSRHLSASDCRLQRGAAAVLLVLLAACAGAGASAAASSLFIDPFLFCGDCCCFVSGFTTTAAVPCTNGQNCPRHKTHHVAKKPITAHSLPLYAVGPRCTFCSVRLWRRRQ